MLRNSSGTHPSQGRPPGGKPELKRQLRKLANSSDLAHRLYLHDASVSVYKAAKASALRARGLLWRAREGASTNIFHAAPQKTGSMWIEAVFSDPRLQDVTGLRTYPGHRYEWTEFHESFPRGTFVPGLYISYDKYEEIDKPEEYATFYVIRDPRDIVVSWYFSMRDSHRLMGKVGEFHEDLKGLDRDEGLHYCIDALQIRWYQMRNWMTHGPDDPQVKIVRFEELTADPVGQYQAILGHCGFDVDQPFLADVLEDYTFEKMKKRDPPKRPDDDAGSNYRNGDAGGWREHLGPSHLEHLSRVAGDLVEVLGYQPK